jgi:hypothetical protein
MTNRDRVKLLFGPYRPPALRRGDRANCLLRDGTVVITGWSAGRISWPRCRALGTHGGGSGLLLDEELARAVRHESAAAIMFWWGVTDGVVWRWRKALGVGRADSEGSRRLIRAASEMGAAEQRGRQLPPEQVERRRRTARELNLARHLKAGYHGPWWTREQLRLLGTEPDAAVAAKVGRTVQAVRSMRTRLGIPNPAARPGAYGSPPWTAAEDRLVRTLPPAQAAARTGRTMHAVYTRRHFLGLTGA